jgi:hypothetical protein
MKMKRAAEKKIEESISYTKNCCGGKLRGNLFHLGWGSKLV